MARVVLSENIHELIIVLCIMVAFISFLVVFHSNQLRHPILNSLRFSLLSIIGFYALYLWFEPDGISLGFWALSRFGEVMILLSMIYLYAQLPVSGLRMTMLSLTVTLGASLFLIDRRENLDELCLSCGLSPLLITFHALIIIGGLIGLILLYQPANRISLFSFRNLRVGLAIIIIRELFLLFDYYLAFPFPIIADGMTLILYSLIYRTFVVDLIKYPYRALIEQNEQLEKSMNRLLLLSQEAQVQSSTSVERARYIHKISHELKNPISVLYGGLQLIGYYTEREDETGTAKLQTYLTAMEKNCDQLIELIDKIGRTIGPDSEEKEQSYDKGAF